MRYLNGLCAGICPKIAIFLKVREDLNEPFDRELEMSIATLEGKGKKEI